MKKKIVYLSLILVVFLVIGTTCFASATMTSEMAENILNFVSQNLDSALDTNTSYLNYIDLAKAYISTIKSGDFANNFNNRFDSLINYDGEYSLKNITLVSSFSYDSSSLWCYFDFFLSNNGYHEDLPYLLIKEGEGTVSYGQYFVRESSNENRINGVRIVYRKNSSAIFGNLAANWISSYTLTKDFYNIDDNGVIYINSVLALDGSQTIYFKGLNDIEASPYICGNSLIPIELPGSGDSVSGDSDYINLDPYFLNAPAGFIETDLGFEVDVISYLDLDIRDYYLAITQYSSDFTPEISHSIRNDIIWQNRENSQYKINLKDYFDFSGDKYFKVFLIKTNSGTIDASNYFYTDPNLIIPDDFDSNDKDEEEIKGGIAGILEFIKNLPKKIGESIAGIFIPSDGFFSDYFSELNDWFSERLGILYFPFDFIVDFFSRIYTSEFKDPTIIIPAMQIPLFEEYGNIYDGTTFNFKEFINQHETFMYIYNLYLIAVDGIVIFGLIRLLMKKYEEVTTNGN